MKFQLLMLVAMGASVAKAEYQSLFYECYHGQYNEVAYRVYMDHNLGVNQIATLEKTVTAPGFPNISRKTIFPNVHAHNDFWNGFMRVTYKTPTNEDRHLIIDTAGTSAIYGGGKKVIDVVCKEINPNSEVPPDQE